jgi:tetratricopeptide (TPR) repeat protein
VLLLALAAAAAGCNMTASGHNVSGVRMYQQARYSEATQSFQTALATDPANADGYYNLGATYHQMAKSSGDAVMYQQAENLYNQCLDRDTSHADCRRALAVLLVETDRRDKAFTMLERWATESPTSADARIELARLYEEFGDNDTATRHLVEAVSIDRTNYRGWKALAHQRELAGDYAQALANYQHTLALNPFQPEVTQRVAQLQQSTGIVVAPTTQPGTQVVTLPTTPPR